MTGIADTGFLVAFANRNDRYHAWALEIASRIDRALLTCDAVLAETAFHLQDPSLVLAMIRDGLVAPRFVVSDHLARLAEKRRRNRLRHPCIQQFLPAQVTKALAEIAKALEATAEGLPDCGKSRR